MDATPSQIRAQTDFATASGRPWWKACCIGCLLLIVAAVFGSLILLRVAAGPSNHVVTALPEGYPTDLEPYRMKDSTTIVHVEGSKRSRLMDILLSPVRLVAGLVGSTGSSQAGTATTFNTALSTYSEELQGLDSVTVSWKNLPARRDDVMAYYSDLFKKTGMTVDKALRSEDGVTDIVFAKRADAAMQLTVVDTPSVQGVDDIELNVEYSLKK